jgi:hypothetical protein
MTAGLILGGLVICGGWFHSAEATPEPAQVSSRPLVNISSEARLTQATDSKEQLAGHTDQSKCLKALTQITLAMHKFQDAKNVLPHDILDKNGKPLLSWRVAILPYLGQEAIYNQFELAEPWDSVHNKQVLAKMPEIYRLAFQPKGDTRTHYLVFAGSGTPFEQGKKLSIAAIPDGTSNTLGCVVSGPAVEWTKPADLPFNRDKFAPKLDIPYKNAFFVAFMDSYSRSFSPAIDLQILKLLVDMEDGQPVPDFRAFEVKLPFNKKEAETFQSVLKEDQRVLGLIIEQLKEMQKTLDALGKSPNLKDLPLLDDKILKNLGDPAALAEIHEEIKKKREELEALIQKKSGDK